MAGHLTVQPWSRFCRLGRQLGGPGGVTEPLIQGVGAEEAGIAAAAVVLIGGDVLPEIGHAVEVLAGGLAGREGGRALVKG